MAKLALCIGINDYPGSGSDLAGCVNDAEDWAKELGARGFEVSKLIDGKATKAAISAAIAGLVEKAGSGDVVVVSYSGHGTWVPDEEGGDEGDGRDEALCPHDYQKGVLLDDELYDLFSRKKHGVHLVLASDSCHSGTVTRLAAPLGEASQRKARFLSPLHFLKGDALAKAKALELSPARSKSRGAGALLLAGCQDTEYSYDAHFGGRANGAFTYVALRALKGLPAGATYKQWFDKIREALPSQDYPQRPNILGTKAQRGWKIFE